MIATRPEGTVYGTFESIEQAVTAEYRFGRDGWCEPNERFALYNLASVAPGEIVEIGTWQGLSTCYLAAPGRQRVHAYDPYGAEGWQSTYEQHPGDAAYNIARRRWERLGLDDRIKLRLVGSPECAGDPELPTLLGLVFIDGDHCYEPCKTDILAWQGRVMPGGFLCLHDFTIPEDHGVKWGVKQAARETLREPEWKWIATFETLAVYQRRTT